MAAAVSRYVFRGSPVEQCKFRLMHKLGRPLTPQEHRLMDLAFPILKEELLQKEKEEDQEKPAA